MPDKMLYSAEVMNENLYREGVGVLVVAGLSNAVMDAQCAEWRDEIGVPLDWHSMAGRDVVRCFPKDADKVRKALKWWGVKIWRPDA